MANDKVDNEIFVTIVRMRKINSRADFNLYLYYIYKEIKKSLDFQDVTIELLEDRIVNSELNSELVDFKTLNLLNFLQSVQKITLTPMDSSLNSNDTPALSLKQYSLLTRGHINPYHLYVTFL